jgi:D-alanyl-D-alanine carboxypeptidase
MKKLKFFASVALVFVMLLSPLTMVRAVTNLNPDVDATAVILVNADTGEVLYSKNPDGKIYPASTTKMMTALLAIEAVESGKVRLEDMVTASYTSPDGLTLDGSTQNIVPGETMSLKDLLYCMLVASANESCNIIGEYIAGGNINDFIAMMNAKDKELGCTGTHYANTHGLHDPNHYTTATDLYKIVKEAMKHPLFAEITNTVSYDVPATNKSGARHLTSTNYLINPYRTTYYYQYAKGVKTGTTDEAGHCLISTASKNGVNLIAVVMGAQAKTIEDGTSINCAFTESKRLYEWAFSNYKKIDLIGTSDLIKEIPVKLGKGVNSVIVKPQTAVSAVIPTDAKDTDITRSVVIYSERDKKPLNAPVTAGQVVGEISVSYKGTVVGSAKLVSSTAVEASKLQYVFYTIFKNPLLLILFILLLIALLVLVFFIITNRRRLRNRAHRRSGSMNNNSYSGRKRHRRF